MKKIMGNLTGKLSLSILTMIVLLVGVLAGLNVITSKKAASKSLPAANRSSSTQKDLLAAGKSLPAAAAKHNSSSQKDLETAKTVMGKLPLTFEPNVGQTDSRVKFFARSSGYSVYLTESSSATFAFVADKTKMDALTMNLAGANPAAQAHAEESTGGVSNYYIGNDPSKWHTNVPNYAKLRYSDVYPGVDIVYQGSGRQLRYDFTVKPGGDPNAIHLSYDGAHSAAIDQAGNLVLEMASGRLVTSKPYIYQEYGGAKHVVDGSYVLTAKNDVAFHIGKYNASEALVIDPAATYGSYYGPVAGGNGNTQITGVAAGGDTYLYVTGWSASLGIPVVNGSAYVGSPGLADVIIAKVPENLTGAAVYSTYLGGTAVDQGTAIGVQASSAVVVGFTQSGTSFPTVTPLEPSPSNATQHAFVTRLSASGAVVFSTVLSGSGSETANGVAVETDATNPGRIHITGQTSSTNLLSSIPTLSIANSFQSASNAGPGGANAYYIALNANGTAAVYGSYLGGYGTDSGNAIAVDGNGNAYITGQSNSFGAGTITSLTITAGGAGCVVGQLVTFAAPPTGGTTATGVVQAVGAGAATNITILNPGSGYTTNPVAFTISGGCSSTGNGFIPNAAAAATATASTNFPSKGGGRTLASGSHAFLAEFNPGSSSGAGSLIYSLHVGGSLPQLSSPTASATAEIENGTAVAVDPVGNAYVGGTTAHEVLAGTPAIFGSAGGSVVFTAPGFPGVVSAIAPFPGVNSTSSVGAPVVGSAWPFNVAPTGVVICAASSPTSGTGACNAGTASSAPDEVGGITAVASTALSGTTPWGFVVNVTTHGSGYTGTPRVYFTGGTCSAGTIAGGTAGTCQYPYVSQAATSFANATIGAVVLGNPTPASGIDGFALEVLANATNNSAFASPAPPPTPPSSDGVTGALANYETATLTGALTNYAGTGTTTFFGFPSIVYATLVNADETNGNGTSASSVANPQNGATNSVTGIAVDTLGEAYLSGSSSSGYDTGAAVSLPFIMRRKINQNGTQVTANTPFYLGFNTVTQGTIPGGALAVEATGDLSLGVPTASTGSVTSVSITHAGSGYTAAPLVGFGSSVTTGVGAGTVSFAGSGYLLTQNGQPFNFAAPQEAGGVAATGIIHVLANNGPVTTIDITFGGSGYTSAPAANLPAPGGTGPVQASGTAPALTGLCTTEPTATSTINTTGNVNGVNLVSTGTGCPNNGFMTVSFSNPQNGADNAQGTVNIGGTPTGAGSAATFDPTVTGNVTSCIGGWLGQPMPVASVTPIINAGATQSSFGAGGFQDGAMFCAVFNNNTTILPNTAAVSMQAGSIVANTPPAPGGTGNFPCPVTSASCAVVGQFATLAITNPTAVPSVAFNDPAPVYSPTAGAGPASSTVGANAWLAYPPTQNGASIYLALSAAAGNLDPGDYTATFHVTPLGGDNSGIPQLVTVTLHVTGVIQVNTAVGGGSPAAVTVNLSQVGAFTPAAGQFLTSAACPLTGTGTQCLFINIPVDSVVPLLSPSNGNVTFNRTTTGGNATPANGYTNTNPAFPVLGAATGSGPAGGAVTLNPTVNLTAGTVSCGATQGGFVGTATQGLADSNACYIQVQLPNTILTGLTGASSVTGSFPLAVAASTFGTPSTAPEPSTDISGLPSTVTITVNLTGGGLIIDSPWITGDGAFYETQTGIMPIPVAPFAVPSGYQGTDTSNQVGGTGGNTAFNQIFLDSRALGQSVATTYTATLTPGISASAAQALYVPTTINSSSGTLLAPTCTTSSPAIPGTSISFPAAGALPASNASQTTTQFTISLSNLSGLANGFYASTITVVPNSAGGTPNATAAATLPVCLEVGNNYDATFMETVNAPNAVPPPLGGGGANVVGPVGPNTLIPAAAFVTTPAPSLFIEAGTIQTVQSIVLALGPSQGPTGTLATAGQALFGPPVPVAVPTGLIPGSANQTWEATPTTPTNVGNEFSNGIPASITAGLLTIFNCAAATGSTDASNTPLTAAPGAGPNTGPCLTSTSAAGAVYRDILVVPPTGTAAGSYPITVNVLSDEPTATTLLGASEGSTSCQAPTGCPLTLPVVLTSGTQLTYTPTPTATGSVYSLVLGGSGSGYTTAPAVTFTGGCTVEPTAVASVGSIGGGASFGVTLIALTSPGSGCTAPPIVAIGPPTTPGGSVATATASISNGTLTLPAFTTISGSAVVTPSNQLIQVFTSSSSPALAAGAVTYSPTSQGIAWLGAPVLSNCGAMAPNFPCNVVTTPTAAVASGLAPGTYNAWYTLTATPAGVQPSVMMVLVTLVVTNLPTAQASPAAAGFTFIQNGATSSPASVTTNLNVNILQPNSTGISFTAGAAVSNGPAGWLQINATSGTLTLTATPLIISLNTTVLAGNPCAPGSVPCILNGTVTITTPNGSTSNPTLTIPVSVTVEPPLSPCTFSAPPVSLTNSVPASGTPVTVPGAFTVTPSAACTSGITWTATSGSRWLTITTGASGSGGAASSVTFNAFSNPTSAATAAQRTGSITITPSSGSPVVVSVTQPASTATLLDRQVTALYQSILGRDPDSGGYAFWTGAGATSGPAALGQMADSFLTSPEAFNAAFAVMATYQAATGAPPTFATFSAAVTSIRNGTQTIPGLFAALIASNSAYSATTLYQNLLNRAPTAAESAACTTLATCFETIVGFPASTTIVVANNEFQSTCGTNSCTGIAGITHASSGDHTNALYIRMLYFTILGRDPDLGGLGFWLGIANAGGPGLLFQGSAGYPTRIQIEGTGAPNQGFVGSPEFLAMYQ
jgi:hypothetical protein